MLLFYVLFLSDVLYCVLSVCKYVLYYCHRLSTQLQLNISHHNISDKFQAVLNKFPNIISRRFQLNPPEWLQILHDRTFYLGCPDVLSPVGDPLSGNGCVSPNQIKL